MFRIRYYVHSQRIPCRCFHRFGPHRQPASAALDLSPPDNFAAPLAIDTHGSRDYSMDNNWFESEDSDMVGNFNTPVMTSRFDWRKFKSSRVAIPLSTPTRRKKYPLRKFPNFSPTEEGNPYYDNIQKYSEQCVDLF